MVNKDKKCTRCNEKKAIAKELCASCYYAQKRGHKRDFEIAEKRNYIEGSVGIFETNDGKRFIVDRDDFEKYNHFIWTHNGGGYAKNKGKYLHRLISPNFIRVDHINQNTFDNRKENLREGIFMNILNTIKREKPCPIYETKQGKWYGQIIIQRKKFYIKATNNRDSIKNKIEELLHKHNLSEFYNLDRQ